MVLVRTVSLPSLHPNAAADGARRAPSLMRSLGHVHVGTHAADMRRLMLEARKRDEGTKAAAEVETAKAEEHFKVRRIAA